MNIKSTIPTIIIGASTPFLHSCKQTTKPIETVAQTAFSKIEKNAKLQTIIKDSLSYKMTDKPQTIDINLSCKCGDFAKMLSMINDKTLIF